MTESAVFRGVPRGIPAEKLMTALAGLGGLYLRPSTVYNLLVVDVNGKSLGFITDDGEFKRWKEVL